MMRKGSNTDILALLKRFHDLGIGEQIDYKKFYLYSIITHSTAIEGSTVTEVENQLLFDEGIPASGRSMEEQLMNLDLKAAYEQSQRDVPVNVPVNVPVSVPVNLDGRKGEIVAIMRKHSGITIRQLAVHLAVSEKTIKRDISDLRAQGIVSRHGADKNGKWIVNINKLFGEE